MRTKDYRTKLRKSTRYELPVWPSSKKADRPNTSTKVEQELENAGWKTTKNGRWVNPKDGKSYNAIEASVLVEDSKPHCCICGIEESEEVPLDSVGRGNRKRFYCGRDI